MVWNGWSGKEIVSCGIQSEFLSSIRCISLQMRQISDRFLNTKFLIWQTFGRNLVDPVEIRLNIRDPVKFCPVFGWLTQGCCCACCLFICSLIFRGNGVRNIFISFIYLNVHISVTEREQYWRVPVWQRCVIGPTGGRSFLKKLISPPPLFLPEERFYTP